MVESVDTRDLKSLGHRLYEFKSRSGYHGKKRIKSMISSVVKPPKGGFFVPKKVLSHFLPNITASFLPPVTDTIFIFLS